MWPFCREFRESQREPQSRKSPAICGSSQLSGTSPASTWQNPGGYPDGNATRKRLALTSRARHPVWFDRPGLRSVTPWRRARCALRAPRPSARTVLAHLRAHRLGIHRLVPRRLAAGLRAGPSSACSAQPSDRNVRASSEPCGASPPAAAPRTAPNATNPTISFFMTGSLLLLGSPSTAARRHRRSACDTVEESLAARAVLLD